METQARTEVRMARMEGVDMHGESERQEMHDEEEECGNTRTMREQERIEHKMTHLPCRSWCRLCNKGRG